MKKFTVIVGTLALTALAQPAAGPGYGPGYHRMANLTPEQQAEVQKVQAEFANEAHGLRTLHAQPVKDTARALGFSRQGKDSQ